MGTVVHPFAIAITSGGDDVGSRDAAFAACGWLWCLIDAALVLDPRASRQ